MIDIEIVSNYDAYEFSKRQEFKWEKGLDAGIKLAGNTGGAIAGMKIGSKIGSKIDSLVGTIVGGIVGVAVGLTISIFTGIVGGKSKAMVVVERATQTKRQIKPIIYELCESMNNELAEIFYTMCDDLSIGLEDYHSERVKSLEVTKEKNSDMLKSNMSQIDTKEILKADFEYLSMQEVTFHV